MRKYFEYLSERGMNDMFDPEPTSGNSESAMVLIIAVMVLIIVCIL